MRLGVLDIGSNTGHLLVVDAHDGAAPLPAYSHKQPLRLAEHLDATGNVSPTGIDALTAFTAEALVVAEEKGCEDMLSFATSAVRDAGNAEDVLRHVKERTGVEISVLSGEDEARLTFLAVRRWFGWSAGRLIVFDIGGGSLEIAAGSDERPDVAQSLPLGAARLASRYFGGPQGAHVDEDDLRRIRRQIRADLAKDAGQVLRVGSTHRAAASSKTFRSLARICGAAPSGEGPLVPRALPLAELREWIPKLVQMSPAELAELPGVSPSRTHQIVPGALVAEACMDIFDEDRLEICPWALREGVILETIDKLSVADEV
jgi:exopolyphosphatase/guanosine-5'-triphosphate,3'-diphosphate pyrophosphatase